MQDIGQPDASVARGMGWMTTTMEAQVDRVEGREEFASAYACHHERASGLAFLLCGDVEAAADVVADAWVGVYGRLGRGPIDDVGPYLHRAVVNGIRSRARRRVLADALRFADPDGALATPGADQHVADRMLLVSALAQLPVRMRTAVVLRYYDDRSVAETAVLMGVSEGTVKSTTSKGLARLHALLEERHDV